MTAATALEADRTVQVSDEAADIEQRLELVGGRSIALAGERHCHDVHLCAMPWVWPTCRKPMRSREPP